MGVAEHGGVCVARVARNRTAGGDGFRSRPMQRIVKDDVWFNDSAPKDSSATFVVKQDKGSSKTKVPGLKFVQS
ncbi:hypothetical protein GCM10023156_67650 [Novipirellula rosea]|uniref:Uncharacterized protein n=1 Tax=Novipirellula rosea TaxID=1031540 RepID=A0ABP8NUZ0_9BACT